MNSVFTVIVISALAVLGLYFLWNMLGELIFGDSKAIAVVPVTSAETPLESMLDVLRDSGVGSIVIVDYSGAVEAPKQAGAQRFRTVIATPERLCEVLCEITAAR